MAIAQSLEYLIQAVEQADSAEKLLKAVQVLAQSREKEAIPTLVKVLAYNNPGAAVAAVDGLTALGEFSVPYLLENLDGYNYGARAWAIRVFATVGNPRTLDLLIESATKDFSLSVRRAAAKGLGFINWSQLTEVEGKRAQEKVIQTLLLVCQDPEWVVRYAAIVALQNLIETIELQESQLEEVAQQLEKIMDNDRELGVCARARLALQHKLFSKS
jgi:phycocyanobilin lyase beta subunit